MHVPQTEVVLRHDGAELARVTLPPGEYVIGRGADAAIRADTPLLSRQHARLVLDYDSILIEDLGSSNGTFVGDQPATARTRLFPNQSVRLGDVALEVRRMRADITADFSLAPVQKAIRRHLPPEILADKRYAIGSIVARGGMGAILDARQNATKRTVAMKVMLDTNDEADVLRFIGEAQVTAQLDHPNIVPIYELGVDEQDQLFYTMKMVHGITLKKVLELLAKGVPETVKKFPLPVLLTIFQKVSDAVAFAHSKGVIHRDLKPENIMLGDFGSVLVMDWGLAKIIGKKDAPAACGSRGFVTSARDAEPELSSTMTGTIMGTPQYMAPEQARGEVETMDQRADIYALGAILFHLLFLRAPVSGSDAMQVVGKVARGEIDWWNATSGRVSSPSGEDGHPTAEGKRARRSRSTAPDSLLAVCRKALALDPAARYARTEDLQADILAYQNGFATSAEKAGWLKRAAFAIKRNKTASAAAAVILALVAGFTAKVVAEGRRAERALTELKKSAPALLQFAESEADSQRFDSALEKIDAALALDPSLSRGHWRRAWILIAQEKFGEAADALRFAKKQDPGNARQAAILPQIERMAAAQSAADRFASELLNPVFNHLLALGASGESAALARRMKLGSEQRTIIVRQRLDSLLKSGRVKIVTIPPGLIHLEILAGSMSNLEILRGLPVDGLLAGSCGLTSLEPLRGLRLTKLNVPSNAITDLSPLKGMGLAELHLPSNPISDLSPLKGMPLRGLTVPKDVSDISPLRGAPLESLSAGETKISDLSPLDGAPLTFLNLEGSKVTDLTPLRSAPLRNLNITRCFGLRDLSPLRGLPLETLRAGNTAVADLTPLQGSPLKELDVNMCKKIADFSPILTLPLLERLICDVLPKELLPLRASKTLQTMQADAYPGEGFKGARPVAEFWRAYDAQRARKIGVGTGM